MSNALAVAATTTTLRNLLLVELPLLDGSLSDLEVTTNPLDVARKNIAKAQLNLFLYQTVVNAGWRNLDPPRQVRSGETASPSLALNLHYLITAYGRGETDTDAVSHRVLGGAMSALHDHPVLMPAEIAAALADSELAHQFERLKVTPLSMNVDEMSKLWMMFQTQYRISAAYEVTVLLIDSRAPARSPLPVLSRGPADRGPVATPGGAPVIRELRLPRSQSAVRIGESLSIVGDQLTVVETVVRFTSSRLSPPIELVPAAGEDGGLDVHLPDTTEDPGALSRWAPGLYTVALVVRASGMPAIVSNEVALGLAPQITVAPPTASPGTVTLTVTCRPRIVDGQHVLLLFGDQQVAPTSIDTPPDTSQPSTVAFDVAGVSPGTYVVRLRVDGVDSIPVVYTGSPAVPAFDPAQKVSVA